MNGINVRPQDHAPDPGFMVLIVEDERVLRGSLATYLRRKGMAPVEAGNLEDAGLVLNDQAIDVLVVDVGLPDGTGLSLLETVPPDRCLVITANPDPTDFARAGVQNWLSKPLDLTVFWSAVRNLAERTSRAEGRQACPERA